MHVIAESCRTIRNLRCDSRYSLVVGVRRFDSLVVVVAVEPDGVLTTILD